MEQKLKRSKAAKLKFQRGSISEFQHLTTRLAIAEETLRAIRCGEVDSVMVGGKEGAQVFTLDGAEHAYRVLIESMNEGALMLTADNMILYANHCFARMVACPLEQVIGSSLGRFLPVADRVTLRPLLKDAGKDGSKIQVLLKASNGSKMSAQISIRLLAKDNSTRATIGMVVTDMTAARRTEELLRTLTHRVVQAQETERSRVAFELHDNITQLLCGILVRSQTLADKLSVRDGPAKREAIKLRKLLGATAEEVERIAGNLRPSILEHLGLVAVLRDSSAEFSTRTGVAVKLAAMQLTARLQANTELALYRIFQEALKNVGRHAHARHVTVSLKQHGGMVQLTIKDDGIGFDPESHGARRNGKGHLGLLAMRERASYVGGDLKIKSARCGGTEIAVRIPFGKAVRGGADGITES